MSTIDGGRIEPDGFTANYLTFISTPCNDHERYTLFCNLCQYVEESITVTLGEDILALIVDREDKSLIDFITAETYWETSVNLAHRGDVIISETAWNMEDKPHSLVALMHEAILYADCFG